MINSFIFLLVSIYNYQQLSNMSTLFSNGFYETATPIPSYTKSSWIDLSPDYILVSPGKRITHNGLQLSISIIVKRGDSKLYPGKLWNGLFAADYNTLYLGYKSSNFDFILGRVPVKWSVSPISSMIFTGYEPGLDLVYYRIGKKSISLDYFFSILTDNQPLRYFVAHRVLVRPYKNLQIGFKDIILYKTSTNAPDMYYFNPFAIYYLRQWELDSSGYTNSMFDFTGEYIYKNFHFYGELMIDDYPYIKLYHENPRMGILGGIVWKIKKNFSALMEYVRINRFTYCYYTFAPYMGFKYLDMPLGHPLGNDFDRITLVTLKRLRWGKAGIKIAYIRHGEGTIEETYRSTSEESENYFLSGVVEKNFLFEPFISLYLNKLSEDYLEIRPGVFIINNYNHVPGLRKIKNEINIVLKTHLRLENKKK